MSIFRSAGSFPGRAGSRVVAVVVAIMVLAVSGCASSESSDPAVAFNSGRGVDEIRESGTVRIGVYPDRPPFGVVDDHGVYSGFDIDYANRIGEDLGVDVEFVPVSADTRVPTVESGEADIILATFTVNSARLGVVDFADPYMKVSLGVVSPDSAGITDPVQLNGARVAVVRGTTAETYISSRYPDVRAVKVDKNSEATAALLDGRATAWLVDNSAALAWTGTQAGFSTGITSLGDQEVIAAAVAKGNSSLLEWLNSQMPELNGEQFFHDSYERNLAPVLGAQLPADQLLVESAAG
ncbi:transporter substrate-binding domain-containing protein [Corynebacterium pacaense]|uniref:transporter substrate-binding domain-containing protein n=1 Tax=Corynebacterium pacaense TaxID=1816684 RepID=UPI0009B9DDD4|nr:transporter substrate-binding domain-containing protein [Corynebacterium pacaense]